MSLKPKLRPLPEVDRRERLAKFLALLNCDHSLAHLRSIFRTGPERQLALFAALERGIIKGSSAAAPPAPDDHADILLCDILDAIGQDPELKDHGSAYGSYRHLANLQVFGLWRKNEPLSRPTALELFTTTYAALTAGAPNSLPSSTPINSPLPQAPGQNGEKIDAATAAATAIADAPDPAQASSGTVVVTDVSDDQGLSEASIATGIIHQPTDVCGEKSIAAADSNQIPFRAVRRGRPTALDDLAKGKLLGLMSYGLSFRQAAAQLGVHHVTILNTMKRDEDFAQQVAEARLDAISQPLLTVIAASRKNWRAAAWLAKFLNDRRTSSYEATPEERELARR